MGSFGGPGSCTKVRVWGGNLQDGLWGPRKLKQGYTGVWVCPGVQIHNLGYTQVFEYARAFGSPNGATYRRLDPQPGLHMGVWNPNRGYTRVFGVPNRGYTGVWSPKRAIVQVAS